MCKRWISILLLIAAVPLCLRAQTMPQPPEIAASSYLLLDVTANQILAGKDIDTPVEPASLTKLMTAYLVFDALRLKKSILGRSSRSAKGPGACPVRACSLTTK